MGWVGLGWVGGEEGGIGVVRELPQSTQTAALTETDERVTKLNLYTTDTSYFFFFISVRKFRPKKTYSFDKISQGLFFFL